MTSRYRLAGAKAMRLGWLAGIGLTLAALGWGLLIADTVLADLVVLPIRPPLAPTFHADLRVLAEALIASGFMLAVIGTLRTGFGVLERFFDSALRRAERADIVVPEQTADRSPVFGRPYRTMPDGSVEVDTLVGTRRFSTMAQAREFI